MRAPLFFVVQVLATALVLTFLVVPVLALFLRIPPGELISQLGNEVVRDALVVTAKTNAIAFGLTCWWARRRPTCWRRGASRAATWSSR